MASSLVASIDNGLSHIAGLVDRPNLDYENIVIYSSWLLAAFEIWIYGRQIRMYSLKTAPKELGGVLPQELFDKAQIYGRDKTRYALMKAAFDSVLSFLLIRMHVYSRTWDASGRFMDACGLGQDRTVTHSLLWISFLTMLTALPGIPWSYYYTFVIEEKHGFNKQTVGLWIADQVKTWALIAVIGLPFMAGFLRIIEAAGKNFVPWLMLFMVVVQLVLQIIYPIFIQPLFNKLTPLPAGEIRERVEKLSQKLGFPLTHLYQIDGSKRSSHSNAYFYGLPWSKHIVVYDTLMEKSSPAEVEAVLGHELGHWYFSHPTKLLLIAQSHLFFILTVFSVFINNTALYRSFHFDPRLATHNPAGGPQPIMIGFMLFQLVLEPLDTVVKFGMNAVTRKYEYQADEFGVQLGMKDDLKEALIKLHKNNLSSPHNDPLYSAYHHSHPTLPERLRAMDSYKPSSGLKLRGEKEL
ncbi:metalloendopeptidase [Dioszegia hungarica]|uniref:CAAX prenyl protease n=1 Tax=Dioszegia hungarica TaxID=4972 RepID=A0AA38LUD6_9TREE|nr:metalloendopeptidase [Dioszegia hungarica]KAI9635595.1 metalloendopeptidase [Dioszegia hungarica]